MFDDKEWSLLVFKKVYGLCLNMWIACYFAVKSFMRWTIVMKYNDASKGDWNYHCSNLCASSIHTSQILSYKTSHVIVATNSHVKVQTMNSLETQQPMFSVTKQLQFNLFNKV